jgi:carboxyl-terminal processing protease
MNHLSDRERLDLDPNSAANDNRDEEIATGKFEYDFETHLAHDVLRASKSHKREIMVAQALPLLEQRLRNEDDQIAKRMAELGVDWQPAAAPVANPQAEVILKAAHGDKPILAGETLTLEATVRNTGTQPLHQVYGVTQADNPLFRSLEFAFGKIMPGQKRTWSVKVKLPADMPPQADSITLTLGDPHKSTSSISGQALVFVAEKKQPTFAYSYRIDDSAGNGDGMLQPGEHVTLKVAVHNRGPGAAEDVTVTLKNMAHSHLFLDSGRSKIGALAVGETKEAELKFRVNGPGIEAPTPVIDAANSDEETVAVAVAQTPKVGDALTVKLGIWDGTLGASLAESLTFVITPALTSKPSAGYVKARPTGPIVIYDGASDRAGTLGTLKPGSVVKALANWGPFVQIALGAKTTGFVPAQDLELVAKAPPERLKGLTPWAKTPPRSAPDLDVQLPDLVVHHEVYRLRGTITNARPLKDAFVFVGDKKIFFRSLGDVVAHNGSYSYALDVPIKLKEGANGIVVIARENDDLMSRKFFSILRQPSARAKAAPMAQ